MAIDVLSDGTCAPIIVGDDADMSELEGVSTDDGGRFHLSINGQQVALSAPASKNFVNAKHILLVKLGPSEEIVAAHRVRIDNLLDGQDLSEDQRRAIAKALSLQSGSPRAFHTVALEEFRHTYPELNAA